MCGKIILLYNFSDFKNKSHLRKRMSQLLCISGQITKPGRGESMSNRALLSLETICWSDTQHCAHVNRSSLTGWLLTKFLFTFMRSWIVPTDNSKQTPKIAKSKFKSNNFQLCLHQNKLFYGPTLSPKAFTESLDRFFSGRTHCNALVWPNIFVCYQISVFFFFL